MEPREIPSTPPVQQPVHAKKDRLRFGIAVLLLLFSFGLFGYLISRFGLNPLARQNSVTLSELIGQEAEQAQDASGFESDRNGRAESAEGQVAGAADQNNQEQFQVMIVPPPSGPTEQTVDFVRTPESLVLRHDGYLYGPQIGYDPQPAYVDAPDRLPWKAIIAPDVDQDASIVSYLPTIDTNAFAFIIRSGDDDILYTFHEAAPQPLRKIAEFPNTGENPQQPKIAQISNDGRYISLAIFRCYDCGNEVPQTMVINTNSGAYQMIGPTATFTWFQDGRYEFKPYQEVACPADTVTEEGQTASCAIDPQFIDPQSGSI